MSTFTGFSEEDLQRIKSGEIQPNYGAALFGDHPNKIKTAKLGYLSKNKQLHLKNVTVRKDASSDSIDDISFEKCRLSLRTPTTTTNNNPNSEMLQDQNANNNMPVTDPSDDRDDMSDNDNSHETELEDTYPSTVIRKDSADVTPDIVRGVDLTDDDLASHRAKLEELQLKQRLMEEQNKKRKEMLSKALADRTRQTEEEVLKLEKIKKELQVLDGQFSQDVNVLRKKIDQACLTYSEAEKHYLKVEKEFLQAKIQLQKEKEKKELLTEHLCALITHNETRKAQKLETLMLELATNKKSDIGEVAKPVDDDKDDNRIIVDGVDERTGKMVEMNTDS